MANTYTQIHIQAIFAVKHREALIAPSWEGRLYQYLKKILENEGHHPIIINGVSNHVHVFFGQNPDQSIAKCMQIIKGNSSRWINKMGFCEQKFAWQTGYGAFSYGYSQREDVYTYVANQKEHHRNRSFVEEYQTFLTKFNVPFEAEYLLEDVS
ncbi:MAG TPA: IS200/IS605 family transposase [Cytophagales bacterium]|nr:IS200/IS605 family transposase [Cytophagales bacterium]